jgi:HAMP domain-containing protein
VPARPFDVRAGAIVFVRDARGARQVSGGPVSFSAEALLARDEGTPDVPLLWDRRALYLRARVEAPGVDGVTRYEVLAPLDSVDVVRFGSILGTPVQFAPALTVTRTRSGIQINDEEVTDEPDADAEADSTRLGEEPSIRPDVEADSTGFGEEPPIREIPPLDETAPSPATIGPSVAGSWRLPGGSVIPCLRWRDGAFTTGDVPVLANAAVAEILSALVSVARDNPLATVALIVLGFLATLLLGTIAIATRMVTSMLRSVTKAVRVLKEATTAIGEGKLDHRIQVEGQDELWSVASSFNDMATGLERVRSMELENERLEQELALAREIQNRLFPARAPTVPEFDIAGTSRSAREVGGDYYDYLELAGGRLAIAVADVSGKGAAAALLMSSFRASLRSHDVAELGPGATLVRLNRFVFGSVTPGKFITAFLGVLNPKTGDLCYACAGHEPPIVVATDGSVSTLDEGGPPLGLIPEVEYRDASVHLAHESLLAIFTDGVTEAQNLAGEFYGDTHLLKALRRERTEPTQVLLDRLVGTVDAFAGDAPQFDDITMVLAKRN